MPELKSIHWDDALALRASRDPFKVAALQPVGTLTASDELGPRYHNNDVQKALERSHRFLEFANSSGADLTIAPEYSIPSSFVRDILSTHGDLIRDGAIYVLPMSSMPLTEYDALEECQSSIIDLTMGLVERISDKGSVNVCAVLTRAGSTIRCVFQAKVTPAALEETNMASGTEIFVIEGLHLCLAVATCADLNETSDHRPWCEALLRKSGGMLCHPQWNPAPDFQAYETFWREALGHPDGEKRMVFALNWARGSTIRAASGVVSVEWARSKILRGRKFDSSPSRQRELSHAGMNVHRWAPGSGSKKRFEIWHAANGGDTVWVWDLVRPFTNQTPATVPRWDGLQNALVQQWDPNRPNDTSLDESEQTKAFWAAASLNGLDAQTCPKLEHACSWDIDRFCSSCRMEDETEWLEVDPTERPSSPLDCSNIRCPTCPHNGRLCSRGRKRRYDAIRDTAVCVRKFADSSASAPNPLQISLVESYPLNLTDTNGRPAGWLLHGRGKPAREVEADASQLIGAQQPTAEVPIEMFVFQVDGDVDPARIGQRHIDAEDEGIQEIMNPEHGREVVVTRLERGTGCD